MYIFSDSDLIVAGTMESVYLAIIGSFGCCLTRSNFSLGSCPCPFKGIDGIAEVIPQVKDDVPKHGVTWNISQNYIQLEAPYLSFSRDFLSGLCFRNNQFTANDFP